MNFNFTDFFSGIKFVDLIIKLFGGFFAVFYLFFSVVILRQTQIMKKTVKIQDGGWLLFFGFIQCILSILLIIYCFFIL